MENNKKTLRKEKRIRFVPAEHSAIFAVDHPVRMILSNTDDPHIKKIRLENPEDRSGTVKAKRGRVGRAVPENLKVSRNVNESDSVQKADEDVKKFFHLHSAGSGLSDLVDFVLYRVIEATDLLLDEANYREKERLIHIIHHCLKILLQIKKSDSPAKEKENLKRLQSILEDLARLKAIAEDEEKRKNG